MRTAFRESQDWATQHFEYGGRTVGALQGLCTSCDFMTASCPTKSLFISVSRRRPDAKRGHPAFGVPLRDLGARIFQSIWKNSTFPPHPTRLPTVQFTIHVPLLHPPPTLMGRRACVLPQICNLEVYSEKSTLFPFAGFARHRRTRESPSRTATRQADTSTSHKPFSRSHAVAGRSNVVILA